MPPPSRGDKNLEGMRTAAVLLAIPTLLIVSPLAGFFLGAWLDRRVGSSPWFALGGLMLGFAAGGRQTYLLYRRYQAEEEERQKRR